MPTYCGANDITENTYPLSQVNSQFDWLAIINKLFEYCNYF